MGGDAGPRIEFDTLGPGDYDRAKKILNRAKHPGFVGRELFYRCATNGIACVARVGPDDLGVALITKNKLQALSVVTAGQGKGIGTALIARTTPKWVNAIVSRVSWFERLGYRCVGAPRAPQKGGGNATQLLELVGETIVGAREPGALSVSLPPPEPEASEEPPKPFRFPWQDIPVPAAEAAAPIDELKARRRARASKIADPDPETERRLKLARLRAELRLGDGLRGESLHDFICRISPHHPPPRHLRPVIAQLEAARRPDRKIRVCFSMPPRHAKTTLIQHAIPWWLSRYPQETCAYASYSDRQAWSKSRVMRTLADFAGVRLADDQQNVAEWRTTTGGGLLSVGAGSGLTGQGVSGLMVVDDPFKNPEDANSQIIRDKVGEWFDGVIMTRIEGAAVFVLHTRWHADDLIGRLAKRAGWLVINLPALAEENDPLGRAPGELLWPERADLAMQIEEARATNAYIFAALYQGRPRPRGGAVFGEPRYYDPATTNLDGCRFVLAADPAASEKTSADYSAAVVLAIKGTGKDAIAYVRHVYRKQVAIPRLVDDLLSLQRTFGNTVINIEAVGGFKAVPQMLRAVNKNLRVKEIVPLGDKFLRAQPAASAWNSGRILVPSDSPPWLADFLQEVGAFTGVHDAYDDQVDALSHAWNAGPKASIFDVVS